jgi:hypothetical protein
MKATNWARNPRRTIERDCRAIVGSPMTSRGRWTGLVVRLLRREDRHFLEISMTAEEWRELVDRVDRAKRFAEEK